MAQREPSEFEPTTHRDSTGAGFPSTVAVPERARPLDPIILPTAGQGTRRRHRAPPEPPPSPTSGRIPGLDGLRAIAVLAVIGFHAAPQWVPGGFLGVDVFFVVSGFLITTILRRERARNRWNNLPNFWLRRARRLLPALALLILVVVPVGRVLAPDSTVGIARQIVGGATFSTNWLEIGAGTDYFAETSRELLRPLWSLAIEEQFYLLWPLGFALLFATGLGARHRVRLVVALAAASTVAMAVLYRVADDTDPTRVYYGTDTHAFGLLFGIALAIGHDHRPLSRWMSHLAFPAALAGLVALFAVLPADSSWTYPLGLLAASLLTLPLLAVCVSGGGPFVWLFEQRPVRWVGERSYGLYLWHWPILVIVDTRVGAQPGSEAWRLGVATAVGLTFVIAALSFRYVEQPIREQGFLRTFADIRAHLDDRQGPVPRLAMGMATLVLASTVAAVAWAPSMTGAERAVADGLESQRVQNAKLSATSVPTSPTSAPPGDAPASETTTTQAPPPPPPGITTESRAAALSSGAGLTVFGDSVVSAAAPALIERYPDAYVDAKPIRTWADALDVVRVAEAEGLLGDFVVLGYGTNGGFRLPDTEQGLTATLDALGPHRFVVIPTIVGISHWVDDYNAALAQIADGRDNVVVAHWASTVAARPGLLHADRTHPNGDGIAVYTEVVAAALGQASVTVGV